MVLSELLTKFVIYRGKSELFVFFDFILISALFISYSLISSSSNNWKTLQGKKLQFLLPLGAFGRGYLSWTWTFCKGVWQ